MKKLLFILSFVLLGSLAYGQLDTLVTVGEGRHNGGGDSKKEAYIKLNPVITRVGSIAPTDSTLDVSSVTTDSIAAGAILYTDTYWKDILVPLTRDKQGQSQKPDFDFVDLGLLFPQNNEAEEIYIILQVNHDYDLGEDIHPHIHYIQDEATVPIFEIEYRWENNGEAVGTWTTIESSATPVFTYTSGELRQILTFPAIDGSGITGVSSMLDIIMYRQTGDGVTGDVLVKELDIHYPIDSGGSREEYVK